jgi:hypothetical protein
MSPDLLLFAVGGLLLVTGLLGGGFELRELKIPRVGRVARVFATGAGGACIVLGLGLSTTLTEAGGDTRKPAAETAAVSPTPSPESGPIHFVIRDELGENQISEQVTVVLDGRRVGDLTVNSDYSTSDLEVSVDDAGRHDYTLSVSSLELAEDGSYVQRDASGQGTITAEAGTSYQVAFSESGDSRDATLVAAD